MSKKKITDPDGEMDILLNRAKELAKEPFKPGRSKDLPSLRSVAEALGTTVIRTRKLLITAEYFTSPTVGTIQRMNKDGKSIEEIGAVLNLKPAAVYAYLPYEYHPYNLPQVSANADRHKRYRATKKLKADLNGNRSAVDEELSLLLWHCVVIFQNYPFTTCGRGKRDGVEFSYTVSLESGKGGRHYEGSSIPGYGNELWVIIDGEKKERSISRSTVDLAFKKYLETLKSEGTVSGPKKLGVFGASYLLPLFQRFVG